MAAALPAKLKSAGIQPFATRAAQLEKFRPIVSYWCEYYILQQILGKQLHTADSECQEYAITLMDKLESFKSSNSANDAITDDVAAKAYMENFATDTFKRADDQQRSNKVTRQTADTFQAAATFIDVLGIWGGLEAEMSAKSKFAKYHALRIAKAIKAGEDPNETNPVVEEEAPAPAGENEDGMEAELKAMETQQNGGSAYQHPSVDETDDGGQQSSHLTPPRPNSFPVQTLSEASQGLTDMQADHDVSPIEPADGEQSRHSSVGGGYFPSVPGAPAMPPLQEDTEMSEPPPSSATFDSIPSEPPIVPSQPTTQQQHADPTDFYSDILSSAAPTNGPAHIPTPAQASSRPHAPPPEQMNAEPPGSPPASQSPNVPAPFPPPPPAQSSNGHLSTPGYGAAHAQPPPAAAPLSTGGGGVGPEVYNTDDDSVLAAQKHAKWAISALNFEDVATAVKELRGALQSLGAR